jgi:hypothetical protein
MTIYAIVITVMFLVVCLRNVVLQDENEALEAKIKRLEADNKVLFGVGESAYRIILEVYAAMEEDRKPDATALLAELNTLKSLRGKR